MGKRRSLAEYRTIDLILFAGMLVIFESIIVRAANWWFPGQPFTVSLAAPMTAIVYMRWGAWGGIHAVLAGAVFCFFSGGTREQFVVYCVGNLASMLALLLFRAAGKEQIRTGTLAQVFPVLVLFLMQLGRAAVAVALGTSPASCVDFFTTDSLSYIFAFVIIWIARRLDGVYEDQKHFLIRFQAAERAKRGGM